MGVDRDSVKEMAHSAGKVVHSRLAEPWKHLVIQRPLILEY
jgi:hypothetical protein